MNEITVGLRVRDPFFIRLKSGGELVPFGRPVGHRGVVT